MTLLFFCSFVFFFFEQKDSHSSSTLSCCISSRYRFLLHKTAPPPCQVSGLYFLKLGFMSINKELLQNTFIYSVYFILFKFLFFSARKYRSITLFIVLYQPLFFQGCRNLFIFSSLVQLKSGKQQFVLLILIFSFPFLGLFDTPEFCLFFYSSPLWSLCILGHNNYD